MKTNTPPAQLWIGNENKLASEAKMYLMQQFCTSNTKEACFCNSCMKIRQDQHPNIVWIESPKNYVVDDLEVIFTKTSFALETNEQFFFILTRAETLGPTCSNRLLKILEEPPLGYHFILLSNNPDALLATIRSRCILKRLQNYSSSEEQNPLLSYFLNSSGLNNPFDFDAELRRQAPSNYESKQLLDQLFKIISLKYVDHHKKDFSPTLEYEGKALLYIKENMKRQPQPGGSTLFWKNFYLSFPR